MLCRHSAIKSASLRIGTTTVTNGKLSVETRGTGVVIEADSVEFSRKLSQKHKETMLLPKRSNETRMRRQYDEIRRNRLPRIDNYVHG